MRKGLEWGIAAALTVAAVAVAVYGAEAVVERRIAAERDARPNLDSRTKVQVVADLRKAGVDAYPVMRAKTLLLAGKDGSLDSVLGDFLPLASLPDRIVVSCNEGGSWLAYRSDRHGFHNPPEAWEGGPPTLALVGDSFAHGSCVASEANMAAHLRRSFGRVVNLGVSGFGPLSTLAAVKEYLEPVKPPLVVWAFFEGNDLTEDLPFELRSPLLTAYLKDEAFSQNLIGRSGEVESRMKGYLDRELKAAMARFDDPWERVTDFLQLYHLRERLGLSALSMGLGGADLDVRIADFAAVLGRADRLVRSWGGRLVLAYLPESARYFGSGAQGRDRKRIRAGVGRIVERLGIPLVDLAEAFAATPDPGGLYVYPGSHFNEEGYRLAAEAVAARLEGLAPFSGPKER